MEEMTKRKVWCSLALPVIRIDMNRGEIDVWDFDVADKISSHCTCPFSWIQAQFSWAGWAVKPFKPHSQ